MSKELEALERLIGNKVFISLGRMQGKKQFANDVAIIENTLKEFEEYKSILKDFGLENPQNLIDNLNIIKDCNFHKKLKAFEIIKNKDVDVSWFRYCLEYCENDTNALKHYNKNCDKEITMEEFELLKEILL